MTRARWINLVGIGIGIAGLIFVAMRVGRDRDEIAEALESANHLWLAVSLVSGLSAITLLGLNWLIIIRRTGFPAPNRRGLNWFLIGQLGKYVPGGIWPIVGQAELAHRGTTPRSIAYSATALSMVGTLLGAAATAAVAGLVSPAGSRIVPMLLAISVVAWGLVLASERIRARLHTIADRFTKRELRLPEARWFAGIVARYLPVWILFSGMNLFVVKALGGTLDTSLTIMVIFVTCVSWMAGFVIIGLPGGLGVREAVFISMMTAPLGAALAVSVAVVSRVVSVAVDLLGAAISVPVSRSAPPAGPKISETADSYAAL
jgi:uncharacterized membrane protein YbhN (UPF0104 family)